MKLDQLVETTFLPPITNRVEGGGKDIFEYSLKTEDETFVPCFNNTHEGINYYITRSGERAYNESGDKTFFGLKKSAIKHCWKYFRYNRDSFKPKLEIKNET